MGSDLSKHIVKGVFWSFLGQGAYLLIVFVTNVILARHLSPYEFGQIGIASFFIVIGKVLTESGLGGSLIRMNNLSKKDYSTVFLFNLFISILIAGLLSGGAFLIAKFYNDPEIIPILISLSIVIIINAFQFAQNARLVRQMKFKQKTIYETSAVFISSCTAVFLAFHEFGVWSIVIMQLLTAILVSSFLWIFEGGIGSWKFEYEILRKHLKFGINTTLTSLLNTLFDNVYQLVIGKTFSISQTGYFFQAKKIQDIPNGVMTSVAHGPIYSGLAKIHDDVAKFAVYFSKLNSLFIAVVGLFVLNTFIFSDQIITLLFGNKWSNSAYFLNFLILGSLFYIQEMFNQIIFKAFDKTGTILKLEIIKKIVLTLTIVSGIYSKDMTILLSGYVLTQSFSAILNIYYTNKILENHSRFYIKTGLIILSILIIIGIAHFPLHYVSRVVGGYQLLFIIPVSLIYLVLLQLFRVVSFKEDLKAIRQILSFK